MESNTKPSPFFFFISVSLVIVLIVVISAFLNLSFEVLNKTFPDILATTSYYPGYQLSSINNSLAFLIIIFPVFLILNNWWLKFSAKDLSNWNLGLKRWVLYVILFLSGITIVTDLIVLVRYFVSGEITVRFLIKVALTLAVAAITGWFYVRKLKNKNHNLLFALGSSTIILAGIIWAFVSVGTPTQQRLMRFDQKRVEDLQLIQSQIINYWQQKGFLPAKLTDLDDSIAGFALPVDPEFVKGKNYEYQINSSSQFELCATFDLTSVDNDLINSSNKTIALPAQDRSLTGWSHSKGRNCFERQIDSDLYPPFKFKI